MTARWNAFDKIGGLVLAALVLVGLVAGAYAGWQSIFPASRWYELRLVGVADGRVGEPITMVIDREIKRPFTGEYTVTLFDVDSGRLVCAGGDRVLYTPGVMLPEPVTLDWWTYGAHPPCETALTPGTFRLRTCVEILHHLPGIGRREVCLNSNAFTVVE